jgi:beta-lactamase regulating signal transducer with metallopeptidase domain
MIPYILHASLIIAVCLLFYKLLLQKITFFRMNRYLLQTFLLLAFALPLVQVPQEWSFRETEEPALSILSIPPQPEGVAQTPEAAPPKAVAETVTPSTAASTFDGQLLFTWAIRIYWFGVAVFAGMFLLQLALLLYMARTRPSIRHGRIRIVEVEGDKAPCSFGNNIYINPEKYDWETYTQILEHERVHVVQKHSLDLLLAEMMLVFQWFNPFAWMYRKEVENNLEFLTDHELLAQGKVEKSSYQMSLLKVAAPNLPLSLTTNYNQSLLKRRMVMMNQKRSSLNTACRYFFLLPVLFLSVSLLNEPLAHDREPAAPEVFMPIGLETEGSWYATTENDRITIRFKSASGKSTNTHSFNRSEFKELEQTGNFSMVREAGTLRFTGKFEGGQGMGDYRFTPDAAYANAMRKEGIEATDNDLMGFFLVDVKVSFVKMLNGHGYTKMTRNDVIPLAALGVTDEYIRSLKEAGLKEVRLQELVTLKALNIDAAYVREIRNAGYPDITVNKLIGFKAQGIDGKYIASMRESAKPDVRVSPDVKVSPDVQISPDVKRGPLPIEGPRPDPGPEKLKNKGDKDKGDKDKKGRSIPGQHLPSEAYRESLKEAGYDDLDENTLMALKAQGVTKEYIQGFGNIGYKNIPANKLVSMKALGITPEFAAGFQQAGFPDIPVNTLTSLKVHGVTPAKVKEYQSLGLEDLKLNHVVSAHITGTTPEYIRTVQQKGSGPKLLNKYIQLRVEQR